VEVVVVNPSAVYSRVNPVFVELVGIEIGVAVMIGTSVTPSDSVLATSSISSKSTNSST